MAGRNVALRKKVLKLRYRIDMDGPGVRRGNGLADLRSQVRLHLQIRAEGFNALNHTNYGTPNRFVNEPQFGTITMAMHPGREAQFSARMTF